MTRPPTLTSSPRSPLVKALKDTVQVVFGGLWSNLFEILGYLSPAALDAWSSEGGERVLVVAPHPDDEVAGCAAAILAHRRHGDRVRVCAVTDGRRSRAFGLTGEQMAGARKAEAEACAAHLDADLEWLGFEEDEWHDAALAGRLSTVLEDFRPKVVYAPSRIDFHPEHERVARVLARVLESAPATTEAPEIRIYGVQVPLTSTLANFGVAADLADPRLIAAFRAHRTQRGSLERCLRRRIHAGGRYRMAGPTETFWRLTPARYASLHHQAPAKPLHRVFRGLRYYAWSDPLAYLRGLGERRRLARLASP